jgi:hypothetical protein
MRPSPNIDFTYNARSELETADRWTDSNKQNRMSSPNVFDYDFDNIGNP